MWIYVRGYQYGTLDGFNINPPNLSGFYVDGVSITYDTPPRHLWTYAAGLQEASSMPGDPVDTVFIPVSVLFTIPLWDGKQRRCEESCCNHTGQPWFHKTLSTSTTATITTRVCLDEDELYVHALNRHYTVLLKYDTIVLAVVSTNSIVSI